MPTKEGVLMEELTTVKPDHAHHWRIDEASGPESEGICRVCGAKKRFRNWLSEMDFVTNEEHRQAA
jgi:hypothetical protein